MERDVDKILVLDFGGQTAQLIGRRIRECGVYAEVVAGDSRAADVLDLDVKGVVLSGSPYSVYEKDAPHASADILDSGLPMLGICYGFHHIVAAGGGVVEPRESREFGRASVRFLNGAGGPLFAGVPDGFVSWMSHGDSVAELPDGCSTIAVSDTFIAAAAYEGRPVFGLQFHPEVSHCEHGRTILENFATKICGARREWDVDRYLSEASDEVARRVGSRDVLVLISGGVDSTVVAALLLATVAPERVHLMYIDTGLMRKNETEEVAESLTGLGARNLHLVDAAEEFFSALEGVCDPEKKREIIGDTFMTVLETRIAELSIPSDAILAQGTLYTDMIESGKGVGKRAAVIKSHHNVRSPLIEAKRLAGEVVEPLRNLYKDEVRALGRRLGVPESIIGRHPFPGPGLAVRILGDVTRRRCEVLREADALFISELKRRELYHKIWQAFCVLLPVRSVGVTGDARNYGDVLALRAITSRDGMTADVYPFEMNDLLEISSLITNSIRGVGRVVYDVSSKPPATIEWE